MLPRLKCCVAELGGVHTRCIEVSGIPVSVHMSPSLNGSSALQCFEICNRFHHRFVPWAATDTCSLDGLEDLWQSHVEIKDYSIVYFDSTAVFKALYR